MEKYIFEYNCGTIQRQKEVLIGFEEIYNDMTPYQKDCYNRLTNLELHSVGEGITKTYQSTEQQFEEAFENIFYNGGFDDNLYYDFYNDALNDGKFDDEIEYNLHICCPLCGHMVLCNDDIYPSSTVKCSLCNGNFEVEFNDDFDFHSDGGYIISSSRKLKDIIKNDDE